MFRNKMFIQLMNFTAVGKEYLLKVFFYLLKFTITYIFTYSFLNMSNYLLEKCRNSFNIVFCDVQKNLPKSSFLFFSTRKLII